MPSPFGGLAIPAMAPHQIPLPPTGVLGILRTVLIILDESGPGNNGEEGDGGVEGDTVTFQTALGRMVRGSISARDLTWEMAARVLARPFR